MYFDTEKKLAIVLKNGLLSPKLYYQLTIIIYIIIVLSAILIDIFLQKNRRLYIKYHLEEKNPRILLLFGFTLFAFYVLSVFGFIVMTVFLQVLIRNHYKIVKKIGRIDLHEVMNLENNI